MVSISRIQKNGSKTTQKTVILSSFLAGAAVAFGIVLVTLNMSSNAKNIDEFVSYTSGLTKKNFELAHRESLGFFNDITDEEWKRRKHRFQLTQPNYDTNLKRRERHSRYNNQFWANNFEPEFTCPEEFRLGKLGDGGKWACDPHRIAPTSTSQCIVYSIGSNGNFDFELEVMKYVSSTCEIHTFDIKSAGRGKDFAKEATKINGLDFHNWGLGKNFGKQTNMKTFKEIFMALGHKKRTVDLMKIDCEKCEYTQFHQWLADWKEMDMVVRQVMLEIHNSDYPEIMDIFSEFQKAGYVMFHKEANYLNEGKSIEAAFLLLSPSFQKENDAVIVK
jgi:hypothetical protein